MQKVQAYPLFVQQLQNYMNAMQTTMTTVQPIVTNNNSPINTSARVMSSVQQVNTGAIPKTRLTHVNVLPRTSAPAIQVPGEVTRRPARPDVGSINPVSAEVFQRATSLRPVQQEGVAINPASAEVYQRATSLRPVQQEGGAINPVSAEVLHHPTSSTPLLQTGGLPTRAVTTVRAATTAAALRTFTNSYHAPQHRAASTSFKASNTATINTPNQPVRASTTAFRAVQQQPFRASNTATALRAPTTSRASHVGYIPASPYYSQPMQPTVPQQMSYNPIQQNAMGSAFRQPQMPAFQQPYSAQQMLQQPVYGAQGYTLPTQAEVTVPQLGGEGDDGKASSQLYRDCTFVPGETVTTIWFQKLEGFKKQTRHTYAQMLMIDMFTLLTGRAQQWYYTATKAIGTDWEHFKRAFAEQYGPGADPQAKYDKALMLRQQSRESWQDFKARVDAELVNLPTDDPARRWRCLRNGMNGFVQMHTKLTVDSWEEYEEQVTLSQHKCDSFLENLKNPEMTAMLVDALKMTGVQSFGFDVKVNDFHNSQTNSPRARQDSTRQQQNFNQGGNRRVDGLGSNDSFGKKGQNNKQGNQRADLRCSICHINRVHRPGYRCKPCNADFPKEVTTDDFKEAARIAQEAQDQCEQLLRRRGQMQRQLEKPKGQNQRKPKKSDSEDDSAAQMFAVLESTSSSEQVWTKTSIGSKPTQQSRNHNTDNLEVQITPDWNKLLLQHSQ